MKTDLFKIGGLTIHGYGFMIALGFILAMILGEYRAKKLGLKDESVIDIAIIAGLTGFAGAKLLFIIVEFDSFIKNPKEVLGSSGFAQGFGRIGCYLAGCCYGRVTDSAFGVIFPVGSQAPAGVKLIPTQLISAGANIIHMIILIAVAHFIGYTIRKKDGRKLVLPAGGIGYLYMILYGIGRFLIEFLRNDYRGEIGILSTSQFISIFFIAAGVVLLIIGKKKMQS